MNLRFILFLSFSLSIAVILSAQSGSSKSTFLDSDNDSFPDFLEIAIGLNPEENECKPKKCSKVMYGLGQQDYLLILLDQSQSMGDALEEELKSKMQIAKKTIQDYLFQTPEYIKVGIFTFGRNACSALDVVKSPFQRLTKKQILEELEKIEPSGSTPIAASLLAVREQIANKKGRFHIMLVTDGVESCNGNPISAAKSLLELNETQLGVNLTIVGIGVNAKEERELALFAKAVQANYIAVHSEKEFSKIFKTPLQEIIENYKTMVCLQAEVDALTLCEKQRLDKARLFINKSNSPQYQSLKSDEKKYLVEFFSKIETNVNSRIENYYTIKQEGTTKLQTRVNELLELLKK